MEKFLITNIDGTKFLTYRFGNAQLTDNVNLANTYDATDRLSHIIAAYSLLFNEQLKSDLVSNHYQKIGV